MAKRLMLIAVGVLALTACTSEDVLDDVAKTPRNAIQFEYSVNKSSRAEELTTGNLNEFFVFGFFTPSNDPNHAHQVFYNTKVSRDEVTGAWSYDADSVRYWTNNEYHFYAYSCGNVAKLNTDPVTGFGTFTVDMDDNTSDGKPAAQRELVINEYRCDSKHQHDLIFAYANQTGVDGANNSPVSFNFNHILSKLQARFTTSFSPEYTVVIKDVQIRNIYNRADFKWSVGWSDYKRDDSNGTGTPVVYLQDTNGNGYSQDEDGKPTGKDPELTVTNKKYDKQKEDGTTYQEREYIDSKYAFVIPNKYQSANVGLSFTIDLKYGDDYVIQNKQLSATLMPEWNKGCTYIYNIDINPDDLKMNTISFSVDKIQGWATDSYFDGEIKPTPTVQ